MYLQKKGQASQIDFQQHDAVLLSCGLVAGAALMDVLLAIPLSITGDARLFAILPENGQAFTTVLGFLSLLGLAASFYWTVRLKK